MSGNRIQITVSALKLFLQSLPPGSMFDIISYGTNYKHMIKGEKGENYND